MESGILTSETTRLMAELAVTTFVLIASTVLGIIAPQIRKYVRSKTTEQQYETIEQIASVAVNAAEQIWKNEMGKGTEKRTYALKVIQAALDERGIKLTAAELEAMVEAAVMKEFNFPEAVGGSTEVEVPA